MLLRAVLFPVLLLSMYCLLHMLTGRGRLGFHFSSLSDFWLPGSLNHLQCAPAGHAHGRLQHLPIMPDTDVTRLNQQSTAKKS